MGSVLAADRLVVSSEERAELERMARSSSLPHRAVMQAKALLLAAEGESIYETARQVGVASNSVRSWRRRFEAERLAGVGRIAKGRGRRSWVTAEVEDAVVHDTLHERPDDGSTHWSTRTMAERHGTSKDTIARIWRKHDLKPWRVDTFKISNDPHFETKLVDVVGLYLNPPEQAVVFSFDEKTQVQALDRTQPSLPMTKGRAGTMTHDYKRNGTTDLFAAMNVATGEVLFDTRRSHSAKDVLAFFKLIDLHVPKGQDIHVVLDNLSAHKAPPVADWLAHPRRARWHLHFTPTSSSWLNLVEGWFSLLTKRRLRRGVFSSVDQLIEAIETWAEHWNDDPKPFVWTKTADAILAKARRARAALDASTTSATHHECPVARPIIYSSPRW
jgi:transposase